MRSPKLLGTWTTIYILLRTANVNSASRFPSTSELQGYSSKLVKRRRNDVDGMCVQLLHIADNFNVDLVSNNGSRFSLVLGNQSSTAVSNVIAEGVQPIRAGVGLRSVFLYGFQSGGTWDRFESLLSNIKGDLYQLHLQYCSIRRLPATFLRGYHALEVISLPECGLEALDINAFDTGSAFSSVLSKILLTRNKLETIDWATFQPAANSLQGVDLSSQMPPLHTIINSKNTTIKELWHLNVNDNRLSFPMVQAIRLDSINPNSSYANLSWTLSNNNLCSGFPSCGCCEARDFVTLAHTLPDTFQTRTNNSNNKLEFTCGDSSDSAWYVRHGLTVHPFLSGYHSARLPQMALYDCCTPGACSNSADFLTSRTVWAAVLFSTFALLRSA